MKLLLSPAFLISILLNGLLHATPSTIIWIPSVDIQPYGVFHLGVDNYFTAFKKGIGQGGAAFPTDLGLTIGVLPFSAMQAEIGIDMLEPQNSPWVFNGKIGLVEGALNEWSPALSAGGCYFGTEKNVTNINMLYVLAGKTISPVGRLSAGYYKGNDKILLSPEGQADETGILLSWDRVISEIDDRLWLAVDYQGGKNSLGAFSFGGAWSFSKNVSVIFAYDIFNNDAPGMFTTQLDINI
jgi:hypothetical protein